MRQYNLSMARDPRDLDRLAKELVALTDEELDHVLAEAARGGHLRPPPQGFTPPVLSGGTAWRAGLLTREEIYADDGR